MTVYLSSKLSLKGSYAATCEFAYADDCVKLAALTVGRVLARGPPTSQNAVFSVRALNVTQLEELNF